MIETPGSPAIHIKKEVYFSIGEKEAIRAIQEVTGCGYIDAVNQMIDRKKALFQYYTSVGWTEMSEQLKRELGAD